MNLEIQGKLQIGHNNLRVFSGKVSIFPIFVLRGIQDFTSALCRKIFPVHLNVQKGKNGRGRTINIVTGTNDLQNITIFLAASIIHQISSHSKKQKKRRRKETLSQSMNILALQKHLIKRFLMYISKLTHHKQKQDTT